MANWRKLLKPRPKFLGDSSLDELLAPGDYTQTTLGYATVANGYPFDGAIGTIAVTQWSESALICELVTWNSGIFTRTYRWGEWHPWRDALGQEVT